MHQESLFIQVDASLVSRVAQFLQTSGAPESLGEVITLFIEYGLETAEKRRREGEGLPGGTWKPRPDKEGVLWKRGNRLLFLPSGTQIMRRYKKQNRYAAVEGDSLRFGEERHATPAALARALSDGTAVNAWTVLWLKRPGDTTWRQALEIVS